MLDNAKYHNKSFLPELRVIDSGVLKGFVIINPRWAAFKEKDYYAASQSVYTEEEIKKMLEPQEPREVQVSVDAGDFDLRGFEVARSELFDSGMKPTITFIDKRIRISTACINKIGGKSMVEILVNPITRKFAIRKAEEGNRNAVVFAKQTMGKSVPKDISTAAFSDTIFDMFGWNTDYRYRISGTLFEQEKEIVYIFDSANTEAFLKPYVLPKEEETEDGDKTSVQPYMSRGKFIRAVPQAWTANFGDDYYWKESTHAELQSQSETEWKLRLEGKLYETGTKLNVTSFDELRLYILKELSNVSQEDEE
jgi:hypothetical protein